jgi:hypothetical protein
MFEYVVRGFGGRSQSGMAVHATQSGVSKQHASACHLTGLAWATECEEMSMA